MYSPYSNIDSTLRDLASPCHHGSGVVDAEVPLEDTELEVARQEPGAGRPEEPGAVDAGGGAEVAPICHTAACHEILRDAVWRPLPPTLAPIDAFKWHVMTFAAPTLPQIDAIAPPAAISPGPIVVPQCSCHSAGVGVGMEMGCGPDYAMHGARNMPAHILVQIQYANPR
ncbi:hypothetical protein FB45DRAFT_877565 [Roridomyces roridus]|uniref:Uncharacterized protein n=1 Tax=Roridomyces roridus TaxID=1738132 RepID=A0AAD7F7X6_9AGAR|nr:hypothetical protein FB45DRAFT_877565 [Roridomyces roridus]